MKNDSNNSNNNNNEDTMKTPSLRVLRKAAAKNNLRIDTTLDSVGWSYWLLNMDGTDFNPPDDNFHTSLDSVADAIDSATV